MAQKKSAKPQKVTLDKILSTVERGFAAVADDVADIKSTMATKEELSAFRTETKDNFRALRSEVADIRRDLDDVKTKIENIYGLPQRNRPRHDVRYCRFSVGLFGRTSA